MKTLVTGVMTFIGYLASGISCIWAVVEFILYLVKDKAFNWWSLWSIIICVVVSAIMYMLTVIISVKEKADAEKNPELKGVKSRFQEKLDRMAQERLGKKN